MEGAEYPVLRGATALLARDPSPVWVVEICFAENHPSGKNPYFSQVFESFWSLGYEALGTANREPVTQDDVKRWVAQGKRDIDEVNFAFFRHPLQRRES